ncbi:hypothetical protein NUU61_003624 [Penicillium alfredii]|uniref:Serine peptidase, family S28 n=1 Tax=Penicillium alfredii TaxID=1506179 RepID=A0A9W9KDU6_9EURO|nr:uncharacterized protein NUU61_003624 [Penicillium alfredii]KAJ5101402.1 hypothetical protein NUU61_003624 [Penicillium alfredii]
MRVSIFTRVAVALAALSGQAAAMGLSTTLARRDLRLSAEKGINPEMFMRLRDSVHAQVTEGAGPAVAEEYVSIPIDHANASVGTYQNRYWVSDEHYRLGGPVFVYDVGESNAESAAEHHLANDTSFFYHMLEEFGGMGIAWEHRYYGKSLPFPISKDTPPEHFQYLTNKQALADIPFFAQNFNRKEYGRVDLRPDATPWVMVGGSYAGMRAAFTRNEYPETIFAAYASSAPVQARIDMSVYFDQVYAGMVANGYLNCTKDLRAAMQYIDGELAKNASAAAAIKQRFFGPGAEKNGHGEFTAALAGAYGFFQAYGVGEGDGSISSLCEHLEVDPTGKVAGPHGFAPVRGREYVAKRFASWPIFTELVNFNYETNCNQFNQSAPLSCVLNPPSVDPDNISWAWQYCTEWGYFQSNNFGPHSLLSRYQNLNYVQLTCNRQFPEAVAKGLLPKYPRADAMNNETGGWTIRPSNVYWSGGEFDPWRTLSPLATQDFAPQGVSFTTDIPKCNVETGPGTVFGYIMENAEHCFDMQSTFAPGRIANAYFHEALKVWLPCFQGKRDCGHWGGFGIAGARQE